jgi:hypothetical protein
MKKIIILIFLSVCLLSIGCRKHIEPPALSEKEAYIQAMNACMSGKFFPNIPKGNVYMEGEMDGKYFSISKNAYTTVRSTLGNFLAAGYRKEYAYKTEWQGNGVEAYPIPPNKDSADIAEHHYYIQANYPSFQGDSLEYTRYFDQFQKGNNFTFRKTAGLAEMVIPQTVSFNILLFQCENSLAEGGHLISEGVDQTNSYFRIADVKNYTSGGQIYKRDVTIEFDVTLGVKGTAVKRIKNGRLFFSY